MNPKLIAQAVSDIPGFVAQTGRRIDEIVTHRVPGEGVIDTVLSTASRSEPYDVSYRKLDDFDAQLLTVALQSLDDDGYSPFDVVPHRHGSIVQIGVYGEKPASMPPSIWAVHIGTDYEAGLVGLLVDLHNDGWKRLRIMPLRIGKDNVPVIVVHRPR